MCKTVMIRPLQNRVTPFGDLIADTSRGAMMGNRGGRIHDPETKMLTRRRWASKQWICCKLAFKSRHREVMGSGYTELFFLDEATALAAGHRPCFECRREDAKRFAACWAKAKGFDKSPRAAEMDAVLHEERLEGRAKRFHGAECSGLPVGSMIAIGDEAWRLESDAMRLWSPSGYDDPVKRSKGVVQILTPPSIIDTLSAGYAQSVFS